MSREDRDASPDPYRAPRGPAKKNGARVDPWLAGFALAGAMAGGAMLLPRATATAVTAAAPPSEAPAPAAPAPAPVPAKAPAGPRERYASCKPYARYAEDQKILAVSEEELIEDAKCLCSLASGFMVWKKTTGIQQYQIWTGCPGGSTPVPLGPDAKQWKGDWIDEPGHTACVCSTSPREIKAYARP